MVVVHPKKQKILPELDYLELDEYIACYMGWSWDDECVCGEIMCE